LSRRFFRQAVFPKNKAATRALVQGLSGQTAFMNKIQVAHGAYPGQNKLCLICDEICPYNAIVFRPIERYRRPVVVASRCNGCGYCEKRCPVKGESAIALVTDGEIRLKEGSYIAAAKKLNLKFKPDPGDDRFVIEESGLKIGQQGPKEQNPPSAPPALPVPKGFLQNARSGRLSRPFPHLWGSSA
jgi:ferredoxin